MIGHGNFPAINKTFVNKDTHNLIVYIGGESELDDSHITGGPVFELANATQSAIVALEHRFFGKSQPFNSTNSKYLKYLTVEQALEDLALFITDQRYLYCGEGNICDVLVVGGSYPGSLSSWFRLKYPHLANYSWSSSAPINVKLEFADYEILAIESFKKVSEVCYNNTKSIIDYFVDRVLDDNQTIYQILSDQYDIPSTIGKVPGAIMRPPGKKPFVHKSHPGPIYNIPSTIGANCPKYTIAKAQIKEKVEDTPGPASYQQLRNPVDPHKVGTLMKGRTKLPESVQCAAPYYDVPQGLEVKKVSIGHKPVVSFDNHVPGPGEYSPVIEEKLKGISIGVKREFTDSTLDVPGPGTYNLRNDEMPQQSIALPGPIDRSLINVNYEKTIPGPGQYTLPDLAEEMTPVTIGKRIEPNLNNKDNPPPYYSTHSTLGGPSFTIGLRT